MHLINIISFKNKIYNLLKFLNLWFSLRNADLFAYENWALYCDMNYLVLLLSDFAW